MLNLVSHKSSAKPSSHGETFDFICERENVVKRLFLYQQRRFTKLGKSAASLLESYQQLQMVVDEVKESNQLVEACRIYLASEIFKTELEVLAYFTHYVTFPFLNCIEKSIQEDLLVILPKLHSDLKARKLHTLSKFVVEMSRVPVHKPDTELGLKLLDLMSISAADGVMLQCGAEYGFGEDSSKRATDLSLLSKEELKGLPTENSKCERNLSVFDNRAGKVAKCRNRRFTGKSIRNDVMLYRNIQGKVDPETKVITKLLDERESIWTSQQQVILKEEIKKKLQKTIDFNVFVKNLLNGCKQWGGPVTSASELLEILRKNPDRAEKMLKTEFAYFVHTHLTQKTQRTDLFKQNNISYEDKLGNFCVLLSDDVENCTATIANLPTNEDGMRAVTSLTSEPESVDTAYEENDMVAVFWKEGDEYIWYLGYVTELINNGEKYTVDHLHPAPASQHKFWQYPRRQDSYDVLPEQIIDVKIDGDWTHEDRNRRFLLSNEKEIIYEFKQTIQKIS